MLSDSVTEFLIPLSITHLIPNSVLFRVKTSVEETVASVLSDHQSNESSLKRAENEKKKLEFPIFDVLETNRPPDLPEHWFYPPDKLGPFQWGNSIRHTGRGLFNYANTCFLNATMQALIYCPPFSQDCIEGQHSSRCVRKESNQICGFCLFELHVQSLFTPGLQNKPQPWSPIFVKLLCKEIKMNQGKWYGVQNCAHEWLVQFLDFLSKYDLPPQLRKDFEGGRVRGSELATCYLQQMFSGCFQESKVCQGCKKSTTNYELNTCIRVPLNGSTSLESALEMAFQQELLTGVNRPRYAIMIRLFYGREFENSSIFISSVASLVVSPKTRFQKGKYIGLQTFWSFFYRGVSSESILFQIVQQL